MGKPVPSVDQWLREAKQDESAERCGMYLTHNGTVRRTSRAMVREGDESAPPVVGMRFGYDAKKWPAPLRIPESCRASIMSVTIHSKDSFG